MREKTNLHAEEFKIVYVVILPSHFKPLLFKGQLYLASSVQFSCSVMSDFLWPHGPQHARPPCSSPTPGVYSNPRPLSQWCHPTILSSVVPFLLLPSIFTSIRVFFNELALHIRWPKYWSWRLTGKGPERVSWGRSIAWCGWDTGLCVSVKSPSLSS